MCSYIDKKDNGIIIDIKVLPNSSKNILFKENDILKFKITSPPVDNKANKFIISFLSKLLKVPKTSIKILKGDLSKNKIIFIEITNGKKLNDIYDYFSELQ